MSDRLHDAIAGMEPISLEGLDSRAALRRRVDTKYVVSRESLVGLIDGAADGYDVLEIDGYRIFSYESVYFDTPDLTSYKQHVGGVRPRFKSRSRLYRETAACFFEVKVKDSSEVTSKRQCDYDPADHGRVTEGARRFLDVALRELADERAPDDLAASLATRYRRVTLAAREGGERATIDLEVAMESLDDREVALRDDVALVETKTEGGEGAIDEHLRRIGCEPSSISKYRLGVGLLLADDPEAAHLERLRACFR
jgi:hypothetical protein